MSLDYQNLRDLSGREIARRMREYEAENAHVMSVVVRPNGDLVVLSPWTETWAQQIMLSAAMQLRVVEAVH